MLMPIGLAPSAAASSDLVSELLVCHARIRAFVGLADRLAGAHKDTPSAEIAETAARVARYFTVALPLHASDEDLSIRPRLEEADSPTAVRRLLDKMSEEHGPIHTVIDEVAPIWREIAELPERLALRRRDLALGAAELDILFKRHLHPEETVIFPAMREILSPLTLDVIRAEMRARRGG